MIFQMDHVKKEIAALDNTRNEKRKEFEEMLAHHIDVLKRSNEDLAEALDSKLIETGPENLLPTLENILHLIPDTMSENKTALLRLIVDYVSFFFSLLYLP